MTLVFRSTIFVTLDFEDTRHSLFTLVHTVHGYHIVECTILLIHNSLKGKCRGKLIEIHLNSLFPLNSWHPLSLCVNMLNSYLTNLILEKYSWCPSKSEKGISGCQVNLRKVSLVANLFLEHFLLPLYNKKIFKWL